jgi:hypothetical protein
MIRFIRQFSQPILWAVVIIVVLSFSFWGSYSYDAGRPRQTGQKVGTIGGRPVTSDDLIAAQREAFQLECLRAGRPIQLDDARQRQLLERTWQTLILREEAARRGIVATDDDARSFIQRLPMFTDESGRFDVQRYAQFSAGFLGQMGMNQKSFEEMMRNQVLDTRVMGELTAAVRVPESEVLDQAIRLFNTTSVAIIEFSAVRFTNGITLSDDEIKKEYETAPMDYSSPERRRVNFVRFALPSSETNLPPAERSTKLNALFDRAGAFASAAAGTPGQPRPPFTDAAKAAGLTVERSEFFSASEPVTGVSDALAFMSAAFRLTPDRPVSDVVELENEFVVMESGEMQPPQPLPLDQVRDRIAARLRIQRGAEAADKAATDAAVLLTDGLKAGKPFDELVAQTRGFVTKPTPFVPVQEETRESDPFNRFVREVSTQLPAGGISELVPVSQTAQVLVHVISRDTNSPDPDQVGRLRMTMLGQRRNEVLREWYGQQLRDPANQFSAGAPANAEGQPAAQQAAPADAAAPAPAPAPGS